MTAAEAREEEERAWLAVKAARAQFGWDSDEHRAARRAWRVVDDRAFEAEQMRDQKERA